MFLWLVANLKQGVIYFIKQALPPNISAGSVPIERLILCGIFKGAGQIMFFYFSFIYYFVLQTRFLLSSKYIT